MLFLLIPLLYLIIGAFIARNDYARRSALVSGNDLQSRKYQLESQLINLKHNSNCWLGSSWNKPWDGSERNCDCHASSEWNSLLTEWKGIKIQVKKMSPYPMMFFYPAIGFHRFLTSGTVNPKGYDPALTARLERELEIGELG